MNRPTVNHTRTTRGGESRPLRLQRIRRPGGKKEDTAVVNKSGRKNVGSTRSMLFHNNGAETDDMSDFEFSVAPCLMDNKENGSTVDGSAAGTSATYGNVVVDMDCDTVGDESLYTTANTVKLQDNTNQQNWEDKAVEAMDHRKKKMEVAGMENSIPTCIFGGGQNISSYGVSKLQVGVGLSGRSIGSLMSVGEDIDYNSTQYSLEPEDPTEEETESHSNPHDFHFTATGGSMDREQLQLQVNVNTIHEEVESDLQETNHAPRNEGVLVAKPKKKNFFKTFFGKIFNHKTTSNSNSNSNKKGHKLRQSMPMQRSPTELWNSTPASNTAAKGRNNSTNSNPQVHANHALNNNTRRARAHAQSVPVKVAPKDLWAPEQAKARGMPGANLRVSTNGVKVWENASGRLVPFSAAEV